MMIKFAFFLCLTTLALSEEGASCNKNGKPGVCKKFSDCRSAVNEFKRYHRFPQPCPSDNGEETICCLEKRNVKHQTTPEMGVSSLAPQPQGCEPIARNLTAAKTGRKSWDKCIEYQERLIYPCRESNTPSGGSVRLNLCNRKPDSLIIGGVDAYSGEFPHMVLLGYADGVSELSWSCGGILISERFILTAGHCTYSRQFGPVTDAKVGILERSAEVDSTKRYKIKRIIKHPEYKPPKVYNDIALLETDRDIVLNELAVPACLHDGFKVNDTIATVTGWGTTVFRTDRIADILQKVNLEKFSDEECAINYAPNSPGMRHMKKGYDMTTQMCYGDWHVKKDSCNGDSGGPIQVKHPHVYCMYSVLGVTSWGKQCAEPGKPAIYTRLPTYVPWIESIVWPDE